MSSGAWPDCGCMPANNEGWHGGDPDWHPDGECPRMTEPTEQEIRAMAEWSGAATDPTCDGDSAWNDGRLLWAMQTKLREHGPVEYGYEVLYDGDWHHGADDAERLWAACREVRK